MNPEPTGRVFTRRTAPGDTDCAIAALTDVSYSILMAGGEEKSHETSADLLYMCGRTNIALEEIVFGEKVIRLMRLGRPPSTEGRKNAILAKKAQAFHDDSMNGATNIRTAFAIAMKDLSRKNYKLKFIILVTDGAENVSDLDTNPEVPDVLRGKTLEELREIAIGAGIHPLVIAVGNARNYVTRIFEEHEYRLTEYEDRRDVPTLIVELMQEVHRRRLNVLHRPRRISGV
jgi:hypothetical protein